jgi:catechol 2,3-dioxygenase-like lactoylglutathione lyase family enzyme
MLKTTTILRDSKPFSTFAVRDLDAARRFYQDTLGLDVREASMPDMFEIHSDGQPPVTVYAKHDHQPAVFTVLNFLVDDVDRAVDQLSGAGVTFEHYDTEAIKTDARGIARGDGPTVAWFRDPAGNILSVLSPETS